MANDVNRRLTIEANDAGFITRNEYFAAGYWRQINGEMFTESFPLRVVERVADRADYVVIVRRQGGR